MCNKHLITPSPERHWTLSRWALPFLCSNLWFVLFISTTALFHSFLSDKDPFEGIESFWLAYWTNVSLVCRPWCSVWLWFGAQKPTAQVHVKLFEQQGPCLLCPPHRKGGWRLLCQVGKHRCTLLYPQLCVTLLWHKNWPFVQIIITRW